ncbi:glycosyltransferase family 4 protein [bacterium]|nr:glycosyltransferase family 4 protein [bacterium]
MKIVYVVPGFGNTFYCQNCMQNQSVFQAITAQGHTAVLAPMYIPVSWNPPLTIDNPIFYGALNVYLKEYAPIFKHLPRWVQTLLNSKKLLHWISKKSGTTDPKGLEKMTISVMQGEAGSQTEELNSLIQWLTNEVKPDVVHLSNALLIGLGVKIKKELGIPVFCTLQDENQWLDKMEEPYATLGWQLIQSGAEWMDGFVSVSQYYADYIQQRLNLPADKFSVIPSSVDIHQYQARKPSFEPMTIGYLSRISDDLGIDTLFSAFQELKKNPLFKHLKLKISGGICSEDKQVYKRLKAKIAKQAYARDVLWVPDLYQQDINAFFDSLTVLSVPSHEPEASGMFILEAMAAGIPVVQPAIGGYVEIIQNTGGGITYLPNSWQKLAKTLAALLNNRDTLKALSQKARTAVGKTYTPENMVAKLIQLYQSSVGEVSLPTQKPH